MTNDESDTLAQLITRTWRGGPAADVWSDVLAEFNHGQAQATYKALRLEAEQTPSIAKFIAHYRSLATGRHEADGPNSCHYCDGYGWISITEHHHGLDYDASDWCRNCTAGKDAKRTIDACHKNRSAA